MRIRRRRRNVDAMAAGGIVLGRISGAVFMRAVLNVWTKLEAGGN